MLDYVRKILHFLFQFQSSSTDMFSFCLHQFYFFLKRPSQIKFSLNKIAQKINIFQQKMQKT